MNLRTFIISNLVTFLFSNFVFAQLNEKNNTSFKSSKSAGLRQIAVAHLPFNGTSFVASDSTFFTYSGTRNTDLYGNNLFDTRTYMVVNSITKIYDNYQKDINTYDANDNVTSSTNQLWDLATNSYVNSMLKINTYDVNKNNITSIYQYWNTTAGVWINSTKILNTYDANNNLVQFIYQIWNVTTSSWQNNYTEIYSYDANNNKLSILNQNWNTTSNSWDNNYRVTFTYNTSNKLTTQLNENWITGSWVNFYFQTNTYDINNNLSNNLTQQWNTSTNSWDNLNQSYYQYNNSNLDTLNINQNWNGTSWKNSERYFKTYNQSSNTLFERIWQPWDTINNVFINKSKATYTYNIFNQITSILQVSWNPSGFWEPYSWNYDGLYKYYYEPNQTGIENANISSGNIRVFPNPTTNNLNITLNAQDLSNSFITIFNSQGILMKHWAIGNQSNYNTTISTQSLSPGNYFILVKDENGKQLTQSFIVSK